MGFKHNLFPDIIVNILHFVCQEDSHIALYM